MTQPHECQPSGPPDAAFGTHILFRLAGHDANGEFAGETCFDRDIRIVEQMQRRHLVPAERIHQLVARAATPLPETADGTGPSLSGHLTIVAADALRQVCSESGYVLLAEYVRGDARVPVGYNFGFTSMPSGDPRFPQLDARGIEGPENPFTRPDRVWTIWKAGVLPCIDQALADGYRAYGVIVPAPALGLSLRRRRINTAFKPVVAAAARRLGKELVTFNVANLYPVVPGQVAGPVVNVASRAANAGMFRELPVTRATADRVCLDGVAVAEVRWSVYAGTPDGVLDAARHVLTGHAGTDDWDFESLVRAGEVAARVLGGLTRAARLS